MWACLNILMLKRNPHSQKILVILEQKPWSQSGFISFARAGLLAKVSVVLCWEWLRLYILAQWERRPTFIRSILSRWWRENDRTWIRYLPFFNLNIRVVTIYTYTLFSSNYTFILGPFHSSWGFEDHLHAGDALPTSCLDQLSDLQSCISNCLLGICTWILHTHLS
jgi:hypothetical protein